jgi:hypothetical protein
MKIYHKKVLGQKTYLPRYKSLHQRQKIRFIGKFWSISMSWIRIRIPNYGSGSKTAKWMRIQVDLDPNPQHCFMGTNKAMVGYIWYILKKGSGHRHELPYR